MIWDEIEKAGLAGVQGVWNHEAGAAVSSTSSDQANVRGHAKAGRMLAANCQSGA